MLVLLPTNCIVCGRSSTNPNSLCHDCESELPWMGRACCNCGIPIDTQSLKDDTCGSCLLAPPPFSSCRGIFHYDSPIDKLISGFKFNAHFHVGFTLSTILANKMREHYTKTQNPDLLLAIPLHRNRLKQRGFNQSIEIARVISRHCQIPLAKSALHKIRDTSPQTKLGSARARKSNLKDAFRIANGRHLESVKSIALIDDVVTTMATICAVSKVLQHHGIRRIDVWCLARSSR